VEWKEWVTIGLLGVTTLLTIGRWIEARVHGDSDQAKALADHKLVTDKEFAKMWAEIAKEIEIQRKWRHDVVIPKLQNLGDEQLEQCGRLDVILEKYAHHDREILWLRDQLNRRARPRG
jgi:hypothetical protein